MNEEAEKSQNWNWSWWHLLLFVQCIAVVWPRLFNAVDPHLAGIPFFYWYQLAWVLIGAALTAIVYVATANNHALGQGRPTDQ